MIRGPSLLAGCSLFCVCCLLVPVEGQSSSACLVNWQYTIEEVSVSGTTQSQTVDACVKNPGVTLLNVFVWFSIWFIAMWLVMLSTQTC